VLNEYRVVGVKTTVPFFQWLVDQPEFLAGRFDTTYLDGILADRRGQAFVAPTDEDEHDALVAAAVASWFRTHRAVASGLSNGQSLWRSTGRREALRS
jgi:acetyl/propionyl-CoA carboxylase alpha subunit